MATTVEGAIQEVLFARLGGLVLSPVHPIAWPNAPFTPAAGNRYLEPKFVPNAVNRALIDSDGPHQRQGFLQVNVRDAKGIAAADPIRSMEVAGLVAARFPVDLKLRHATGLVVRITAAPSVASMLVENTPPGVVVPVLVPWECWA